MSYEPIQETIFEALDRPSIPRVFVHLDCGGYVLWNLQGGTCQRCGHGPVRSGEYAKPGQEPAATAPAEPLPLVADAPAADRSAA